MAIVLSKESEQVVYKTKRIEAGVTCDICERFIKAANRYSDVNKYFEVRTGHHEWGNDSCESIEHRDICPDCIGKFVIEYLRDGYDSAYIDIETEHAYPNTHWDD